MDVWKILRQIDNLLKRKLLPANVYARSIGVKMGKSCKISSTNFGTEPYLIELGDHVHVTSGVTFITHEGGLWIFRMSKSDFDVFGKIKVGSNTYIGNNASILYGVEIGKNGEIWFATEGGISKVDPRLNLRSPANCWPRCC